MSRNFLIRRTLAGSEPHPSSGRRWPDHAPGSRAAGRRPVAQGLWNLKREIQCRQACWTLPFINAGVNDSRVTTQIQEEQQRRFLADKTAECQRCYRWFWIYGLMKCSLLCSASFKQIEAVPVDIATLMKITDENCSNDWRSSGYLEYIWLKHFYRFEYQWNGYGRYHQKLPTPGYHSGHGPPGIYSHGTFLRRPGITGSLQGPRPPLVHPFVDAF